MTKVVQDFLWAQKVQEPVALFSDWLYVGHIDEFMTFVPAPDRKVNIALFFSLLNSHREERQLHLHFLCVCIGIPAPAGQP